MVSRWRGLHGTGGSPQAGANRPDDRIVVIEAGVCGENAAGRNSGFAADVPHMDSLDPKKMEADADCTRLSRAGIASLREQVNEFGLDCDWREDGKY
ncbi:MAG: hypothetical protein AB8B97_26375 [Granulosicoccus sp.]